MHVVILLACLLTLHTGCTGHEVLVIENDDQGPAGLGEMEDISSVLDGQFNSTMDAETTPILNSDPAVIKGAGEEKEMPKAEQTNLPSLKVYDHKRIADFSAFELFHFGQRVVTNLTRPMLDSIALIEKVTLKGQGLNLNLKKEDAVEQFLGEDTTPDHIKNVHVSVITRNINGLPERFFIFSYSSGGKNYSLEPSHQYHKNSDFETFNQYQSKVIQDIVINGINHTVYEVEEKEIETTHVHLPLVMVVDDSIVNRFLNSTTTEDEAFEEARKYLMAMEVHLNTEVNGLSTTEVEFTASIDGVIRFAATSTSPSEDKENLDVESLLNDDATLEKYRDKIVVFMTKQRVIVDGTQIPGIGSGDICNQPRILLQATEFFQVSRDLVQLLKKLLGLCDENESEVQNSAGCQKEAVEENLRMKKNCLTRRAEEGGSALVTNLSLKSQCQFVYGPGYMPCMPQETDGICSKLTCKHQSGFSGCASLKGMKALPGSPCAPGRLCRNGECTLDVGAPLEFDWHADWHVEGGSVNCTCTNVEGSLERLMIISLVLGSLTLIMLLGSVIWTLCLFYGRKSK